MPVEFVKTKDNRNAFVLEKGRGKVTALVETFPSDKQGILGSFFKFGYRHGHVPRKWLEGNAMFRDTNGHLRTFIEVGKAYYEAGETRKYVPATAEQIKSGTWTHVEAFIATPKTRTEGGKTIVHLDTEFPAGSPFFAKAIFEKKKLPASEFAGMELLDDGPRIVIGAHA